MTPQDKTAIEEWNRTISRKVLIRFSLSVDERSRAFEAFSQWLLECSDNIEIERITSDEEKLPEISIGNTFIYQAVPDGPELIPFLELLSAFSTGSAVLSESVTQLITKVRMPIQLKLFISSHCPFCPQAVRSLFPLSIINPLIRLLIIDGSLFPELSAAHNIRSAPSLLLDSAYQWSGTLNLEEIAKMLVSTDPSGLSAATLEDMIKDGNASRLAELMLDKGMILPAFVELLLNPYFSTRLGAMTVMEEISELNPALAQKIVSPLMEQYPAQSESIKGDILYTIGLTANQDILPVLQQIVTTDEPAEVIEAAQDAIAAIIERCSA